MDLKCNKLETLLGTSFGKLINHYVTSLFRTKSNNLGTFLDSSSGKLTNQYITSLFITILAIVYAYLRVVVELGLSSFFSLLIISFNSSEGR